MKALILGGYGNFGKRIAGLLTRKGVAVVIAGRDAGKAEAAAKTLPPQLAAYAAFDAKSDLARQLTSLQPSVVINTCGPFQNSDYGIAETCIAGAVHYIDLADGRDFVTGITALDAAAKKQNVAVISGAWFQFLADITQDSLRGRKPALGFLAGRDAECARIDFRQSRRQVFDHRAGQRGDGAGAYRQKIKIGNVAIGHPSFADLGIGLQI